MLRQSETIQSPNSFSHFSVSSISCRIVNCPNLKIFASPIRIYTEEKAKFIAAVWGEECFQFLAALAILHQDDLKNMMNSSYSSYHPDAINPLSSIHPGVLYSKKLAPQGIE